MQGRWQSLGESMQSFQKYVCQQDKYDLPTQQPSYNSQTLLIEATPKTQKTSFCLSQPESAKHSFILKKSKENEHYCDINQEFQITINGQQNEKTVGLTKKIASKRQLEELCGYLIDTIKELQIKIQKLQENEKVNRKLGFITDQQSQEKQQLLLSLLNFTQQSLTKKAKTQQCQSRLTFNDLMKAPQQEFQSQIKANAYFQQMQKAQIQLGRVLKINEQYRQQLKKLNAENKKCKQLIKQYQIYYKKHHQTVPPTEAQSFITQQEQINQFINKVSSQIAQKFRLRDNSLDKKLKDNQTKADKAFKKDKRKYDQYFSPQIIRRVEKSTLAQRETPKTPQQLPFRKFNRQDSQKTELKGKHRSCNGLLKNIVEFQQKNQSQMLERLYSESQIALGEQTERLRMRNYPYNQLVKSGFLSKNAEYTRQPVSLTNFQTMESLQQMLDEHESFIQQQGSKAKLSNKLQLKRIASDILKC